MPPIRIATATDRVYFPHLVVMLRSMLDSNPGTDFDVTILSDDDLSPDWRHAAALDPDRLAIRWHRLDEEALGTGLRVDSHVSLATWLRLFMARFFAADVDRLLYLDPDMLVTGDLRPLWALDLAGHAFAAVEQREYPQKVTLGLAPDDPYLNAGVLLIDLAQWRAVLDAVDLPSFLAQHGPALRYHDQDAINILFQGRWLSISPKWNLHTDIARCVSKPRYLVAAQPDYPADYAAWCADGAADARIVHFTGPSKPWNHYGALPFHDAYWAVRGRTGYDATPEDRRVPWSALAGFDALWIYGASQGGAFTQAKLQALGYPVAGFIDTFKRGRSGDLPILLPDDWVERGKPGAVVIASMFWRPMLAEIEARAVDAPVFVSYPFLQEGLFRFDGPPQQA